MKTTIRISMAIALVMALSVNLSSAQSKFKSIMGNLKNAAEQKVSEATGAKASIVGSWEYDKPAVKIQGDDVLAEAGSVAATALISDNLAEYFGKIGIQKGSFSMSFTDDGNISLIVKDIEIKGKYTMSADNKKMKMDVGAVGKNSLTSMTVDVIVTAKSYSLLFNATSLLSFVKAIVANFPSDVSFSSVEAALKEYDKALIGFGFSKKK